jgi:hypothetical protein
VGYQQTIDRVTVNVGQIGCRSPRRPGEVREFEAGELLKAVDRLAQRNSLHALQMGQFVSHHWADDHRVVRIAQCIPLSGG